MLFGEYLTWQGVLEQSDFRDKAVWCSRANRSSAATIR